MLKINLRNAIKWNLTETSLNTCSNLSVKTMAIDKRTMP